MIFYQIFISFHLVLPFSHLPQRSGKITKKFQHSTDRFLVRQRDELFVSNISRNLGSFTTSSICLGLRGSSDLLNPLWSQVNGRGWSQQSKSWSFPLLWSLEKGSPPWPLQHVLRASGGETQTASSKRPMTLNCSEYIILHIHCVLKKREGHNLKILFSSEYE